MEFEQLLTTNDDEIEVIGEYDFTPREPENGIFDAYMSLYCITDAESGEDITHTVSEEQKYLLEEDALQQAWDEKEERRINNYA